MIIKSLYIADFSGTRGRTLDFSSGFNIIEGDNESGKTTVASFIKFMLYGFADKAERTRLYSWGSSSASGTMTVTHDGHDYRIEREYTEGGREKASIIDLETATPCFEGRAPADIFLGVPAEVFAHTAFIGQAAGGTVDGEKVSRAIENLLFSADESVNTDRALKKLDSARTLLYHKNRKGGRIYDLVNERDELRIRLENAKQANSGLISREGSLRETNEQLAEAREKLSRSAAELEECDAAKKRQGLARLDELCRSTNEAGHALDALNEKDGYNGFLPDPEYAAALDDCERRSEATENALAAARGELAAHNARAGDLEELSSFIDILGEFGGEEGVTQTLDRMHSRRRSMSVLGVLAFIFAAVFAAGAAAAYLFALPDFLSFLPEKPVPALIAGGAALVMLVIGITAVILRSHAGMAEKELLCDLDIDSASELGRRLDQLNFDETRLKLHNSKSKEFEERITSFMNEKKELARTSSELLARWGKSELKSAAADAAASVARRAELTAELEKFTLARDTLAAQLGVDDPEAAAAGLTDAPAATPDPERAERVRREYDFYTKQIQALDERARRLERELAVLEATVEQPAAIADKINVITSVINDLTRRYKALVMAGEALNGAASGLRESVSPRLSKTAGELIGGLTGGAYTSLGVGHSLELAYEADAQTRGIEYMSAGTRDLAYLSLRFALIGLLYRELVPPLIFDESFSRLDDSRYANVLALISQMSGRGTQTLLFTSQKRDADLALRADSSCKKITL